MFGKKRNDDEYFIGKKKKKDSLFFERLYFAAIATGSTVGLFSVQDTLAQMFLIIFAMAGAYGTVFPK